ncbi:hypothetical protein [Nocardia bovistercoris]|uniref:Uncharacterized protein n=1 Tax=Nocardia bovistercoris TaxID=2785916 RepID=A0A931IFK0_9NOCA|nr:hypothetical protein [Nocardia bovistercoris]MBH0780386.1 hypothetical protein [Nocardia bovistercoris]
MNIVLTGLLTFLGFLTVFGVYVISKVIAHLVGEEVEGRINQLGFGLLRLVCRRLPEDLREVYYEFWAADLEEYYHNAEERPLTRLFWSLRFPIPLLFTGRVFARIQDPKSFEPSQSWRRRISSGVAMGSALILDRIMPKSRTQFVANIAVALLAGLFLPAVLKMSVVASVPVGLATGGYLSLAWSYYRAYAKLDEPVGSPEHTVAMSSELVLGPPDTQSDQGVLEGVAVWEANMYTARDNGDAAMIAAATESFRRFCGEAQRRELPFNARSSDAEF